MSSFKAKIFICSKPLIRRNRNITYFITRNSTFSKWSCEKYITNHFQNNELEYQANKYMIHEVMKLLDEKYEFTPHTNYQQIIENLNLPYHLDGVIVDEYFNLIQDKFSIHTDEEWENYH